MKGQYAMILSSLMLCACQGSYVQSTEVGIPTPIGPINFKLNFAEERARKALFPEELDHPTRFTEKDVKGLTKKLFTKQDFAILIPTTCDKIEQGKAGELGIGYSAKAARFFKYEINAEKQRWGDLPPRAVFSIQYDHADAVRLHCGKVENIRIREGSRFNGWTITKQSLDLYGASDGAYDLSIPNMRIMVVVIPMGCCRFG